MPDDDQLGQMIDEELLYAAQQRTLSSDRNAAWQILHGVLAFGPEFPLQHGGKTVPAMPWVMSGGRMEGWTMRKGAVGLKAVLESGSLRGQGHEDQWLAVIAQCDIPSSTEIKLGDRTFEVGDIIKQAMYDVYEGKECSWTLIALSHYLPLDTEWENSRGETWTIERIMQMEAEQELGTSACGGSHRLIGLTMALQRYRKANPQVELTGGWLAAEQTIQDAITKARQYQLPDGAFSVNYFQRPGDSRNLPDHLGATGHTLEFLALALDEEQLAQPWVTRAVVRLCELFELTRPFDLECGGLYHAAHGLVLYRQRRFGPRDYLQPMAEESLGQVDSAAADSDI